MGNKKFTTVGLDILGPEASQEDFDRDHPDFFNCPDCLEEYQAKVKLQQDDTGEYCPDCGYRPKNRQEKGPGMGPAWERQLIGVIWTLKASSITTRDQGDREAAKKNLAASRRHLHTAQGIESALMKIEAQFPGTYEKAMYYWDQAASRPVEKDADK
jgi:hypothetical protein